MFFGVVFVPYWYFQAKLSWGGAEYSRAILQAARALQANTEMHGQESIGLPGIACPKPIRDLDPSYVFVSRDKVHIEKGGGHFHYGIDCFREGIPGEGKSKIIEGLWFVSE